MAEILAPLRPSADSRGRHHAVDADDSPTLVVPMFVAPAPPVPPAARPTSPLTERTSPAVPAPPAPTLPAPAPPAPAPPAPSPLTPPMPAATQPAPPPLTPTGWFERLGVAVTGRPRSVIAIWVLLLAGLGALGIGLPDRLAAGGFEVPGSQSLQVQQILQDRFPGQAADPVVIVVQADPAAAGRLPDTVTAITDRVRALDGVRSVRSFLDQGAAGQLTPDGSTTYLSVAVDGDQSEQLGHAKDIEAALGDAAPAGVEISVGGRAAFYNYQNEISRSDLEKAELITFPVTLVVLLLVFGSAVAAGLPVLLAMVSLGITLGLLYLLTLLMPLSVFVTNTATVIGIGVGIDYALFIVTRYREELAAGSPTSSGRRRVGGHVRPQRRRVRAHRRRRACRDVPGGHPGLPVDGGRTMMVVTAGGGWPASHCCPPYWCLSGRGSTDSPCCRRVQGRHRASGWHLWTTAGDAPSDALPDRCARGCSLLLAAPLTGIVLGQPSADTLPAGSAAKGGAGTAGRGRSGPAASDRWRSWCPCSAARQNAADARPDSGLTERCRRPGSRRGAQRGVPGAARPR